MRFSRLYMIGNGFDLWHGIPSGYRDFKAFVRARDWRIYEDVESYLPAGDDWAGLESALANIDVEHIVEELGQFAGSYGAEDWSDSGHGDFQYEVEELTLRLSTKLRSRFAEWIRGLPIPNAGMGTRALSHLDTSAAFLSFNYTCTLQSLYGVQPGNILHIHGNAGNPTDALILGHAWNPSVRRLLTDRTDAENFDTRLMEGYSIIDEYFSSTFKPSARLITENKSFFEGVSGSNEVYVLGHSLSEVDWPYFEALINDSKLGKSNWWIACRFEEEFPEKQEALQSLGVDASRIQPIFWERI